MPTKKHISYFLHFDEIVHVRELSKLFRISCNQQHLIRPQNNNKKKFSSEIRQVQKNTRTKHT